MGCFVPFNSRNLDISLFAFRPMVVFENELLNALKHFSSCTQSLGCVHSAIFRSIHGNMIIWYGAWMKRSNQNKELLNGTLLSMLLNVSTMALLIDHSFFDAYAGESHDGSPAAKFSTGDTISMNAILFSDDKDGDSKNDAAYAFLAIFGSRFSKMDGAISGVCLKCQSRKRSVNLFVWKSLQSCYTWILTADYRKTILPFLDEHLPLEIKYDMFRVVYVSGDDAVSF